MNLKVNFIIIKPIQLPWEFVSPTEEGGLEYHLSPDLSIRMNGIVTGDKMLHVGQELIVLDDVKASEMDMEDIFQNEILANKSKERIIRAFKDGRSSCFFTTRQKDYFLQLFTERKFMSNDVKVQYKGRRVDNIEYLPPKEHGLVMAAFVDLDVKWCLDSAESQSELNDKFEQSIKENAGRLGNGSQTTKEKFKEKRLWRRIAFGLGSVMLGVSALLCRLEYSGREGIGAGLAAIAFGTVGILLEAFGRSELISCIRNIRMDY